MKNLHIWQFNKILKKIADFQQKFGNNFTQKELEIYLQNNIELQQVKSNEIIDLGTKLNFFTLNSNSELILTEFSRDFLNRANGSNLSEFTPEQKDLIKKFIVNSNEIFLIISPIYQNGPNLIIEKNFPDPLRRFFISLIKELGLLKKSDNPRFFNLGIEPESIAQDLINPIENVKPVFDLDEITSTMVSRKNHLKEEELFNRFLRQNEIGKKGEDIALEFEKNRVRNFEPELVNKVKLISSEAVDKGYDIDSFNEDRSPRYIEVKTTETEEYRFFISRNELKVANLNVNNYWLYFVKISADGIHNIIGFPNANCYFESGFFSKDATHYEVEFDLSKDKFDSEGELKKIEKWTYQKEL